MLRDLSGALSAPDASDFPPQPMRIATWNVNSVRTRLAHLCAWLEAERPEVVCLQETKVVDADFPAEALRAAFAALPDGLAPRPVPGS